MYIYCFPHKISLYRELTSCPVVVFSKPVVTSFEVIVGEENNSVYLIKYKVSKTSIQTNFSYIPEWSNRINFHVLTDSYKKIDLTDLKEEIEKSRKMSVDHSSKAEPFLNLVLNFRKSF